MLVSWSSVTATYTSSVPVNFTVLCLELALAFGIGAFLAMRLRSPLLACTVAWAVFWVGMMTLNPVPPSRLEKYNEDFGETGRIVLAYTELALAACLVVVGFLAWRQPEVQ